MTGSSDPTLPPAAASSSGSALPARPVRESYFEYSELTLPNDANPLGTLFGGKLMQWVDLAASISAARHARCAVVTASIDSLTFLRPVKIGQLVILKSAVNRVFRSSMEIGVKVWQEDRATGDRKHVASAYLTFVSLDPASRKPNLVPPVLPQTPEEQRRYDQAQQRRQRRLAERH